MARRIGATPAFSADAWANESPLFRIGVAGTGRRRFSPPVFHRNPPHAGGAGGHSSRIRPEFGGGPNPTALSAPSLAVRPTGEVDIAVQGFGNTLMYYFSLTPGGPWRSTQVALDGSTTSAPALVVRASGEADIVAQGPNNSLWYYHATPGSAWSKHQIAGSGSTLSQPSLAVGQYSGNAYVAVQGPNSSLQIYRASPGGAWAPANEVAASGMAFSAPSMAMWEIDAIPINATVYIAVEGPENSLGFYTGTQPSGSSAYPLNWGGGGELLQISAPYLGPPNYQFINIVATAGSENVVTYYGSGALGFQGFPVAGGSGNYFAPSLYVRSTGELDIVAADVDGFLNYFMPIGPGPTTQWQAQRVEGRNWTGGALSQPSIFVDEVLGVIHIATQRPDASLWHYTAPISSLQWSATQVGD
jgi:hypothetical protein